MRHLDHRLAAEATAQVREVLTVLRGQAALLLVGAEDLAGERVVAQQLLEVGGGIVTASTYEAGNCFLIVAGLLNFLVILDAFDIGMGRK